jgi:predicted  nucleic acid-binding Zn-ribbon protein
MASPAYAQLLVVQGHDTLLDQLRHRHEHHSLRDDLAAVQAQIAEVDSQIEAIKVRRHDLDRERKRLDDEVAKIQAKRDEINRKLYDGSVTATKDLLAMQDEAKSMAARQSGMEDEELEFMEQIESVSGELAEAENSRAELDERAGGITRELEAALVEIDAQVASETQTRAADAGQVPDELMAVYEKLRTQLGGIAVARLNGSMCDGCHMTLSAVTVDRAKHAPDDAVIKCDECGRLLIL